jgi:hypothetical protein
MKGSYLIYRLWPDQTCIVITLLYHGTVAMAQYCSISFKSTPGMTRAKKHFDISTTDEIWRDTFDIGAKIWAFPRLTANFEPCVTLGRFDNCL